MAKLLEHLEYHEDDVEKHSITAEEIQFLKELQREMNTQDNVGQADPRYWVIRNYKKIYGESLDYADGICIFDNELCGTVCEVQYKYFNVDDTVKEIIECIKEDGYELEEETIENIKTSYDIESLMQNLRGISEADFSVFQYQDVADDEGFFFTRKSAEEHLRANEHHYASDAHTYAKTAWRSNEKRLWNILRTVDFNALN